ncbi:MAG: glycosyltransferase [bacterium]
MNSSVKVSVVVPTFNRASMLVDGSTDNTVTVVSQWISEYTSPGLFEAKLVSQPNQGGNVARNRGIAESEGELVAFLDSDDTWLPTKLERQMEVLETTSECGAVYCGVQHMDGFADSVKESPARAYPQGDILDELLIRDVTSPTSAYLIKRSVFEEVGNFDENLQARQDWDMWIRIASRYCIAAVPEVLVNYREHEGERTATVPEREIQAYKSIRKKYRNLIEQQPLSVRLAARSAYLRRRGRVAYHYQQQPLNAAVFYIRSILSWPFEFDSYAALFGLVMPASLRRRLHVFWNRYFGKTRWAIRSH